MRWGAIFGDSSSAIGAAPMVLVVLLGFLLIWKTLGSSLGRRKREAEWSRSVPFSNQQLSAMRTLWQAFKSGRDVSADPLKLLSPRELSELLSSVALENKPADIRLKDEARLRRELITQLESQGMPSLHAEIVVGMKYGRLGSANDL